jgi:class 3 adenylate cyclase/DNA-binding transcriptional MerR regulator
MTLDDVVRFTGESSDEIRRWQELGLLPEGDDFGAEDLERIGLVSFAARRGVSADEMARYCREHGDWLEVFARWGMRPGQDVAYSREEIARRAELDPEVLARVLAAAGLRDRNYGYEDDLESVHLVATALKFGFPREALLQILRVTSDSLGRVSEAMVRLFHVHVHERFRADGLSGPELMAATQNLADPMSELVEPTVMYFHRKAWERANREDMILHLLEEAAPPAAVPGEIVRTILFVDLSSFTPLTEAMGDAAAAGIVERFSDMVRDKAADCDGQVLKQIGDEFMLVFPDPQRAVSFGIGMQQVAAAEPRFPALRIGAQSGSILYREGDYVGANVNLAARVTSAAMRNQFLVTDAVRQAVDLEGVEFDLVGSRSLKGVSEPVDLFEVRTGEERSVRTPDPVCGMELDEESAEARLAWQGQQLLFCSEECLRRFLQDPDRYRLPDPSD